MPVFKITHQVEHIIVIKADNEDQAHNYVEGLGDDGFPDVEWGDVSCKKLANNADFDEDLTGDSEE